MPMDEPPNFITSVGTRQIPEGAGQAQVAIMPHERHAACKSS